MPLRSLHTFSVSARSFLVLAMGLAACSSGADGNSNEAAAGTAGAGGAAGAAGAGGTAGDGGAPAEVPKPKVASLTFGEPTEWARPIEDYISKATAGLGPGIETSIQDLVAFDGALYFGYGDGSKNAGGVVPIELRAFSSPDDATPVTQLVTIEEVMSDFRVINGQLYVPGPDATDEEEKKSEPVKLGNIYRLLDDGNWATYRTVPGGEHVHDIRGFDGRMWAVGSGADDRTDWDTFGTSRYLWESSDDGANWQVKEKILHDESLGVDSRWTRLLELDSGLYLFGYQLMRSGQYPIAPRNARLVTADAEVEALAEDHLFFNLVPYEIAHLPDGSALITGADLTPPASGVLYHVSPDGSAVNVAGRLGLAGSYSIDIYLHRGTGEVLLLVTRSEPEDEDQHVQVIAFADPGESAVVLDATLIGQSPTSVAYWEGSVYLGTSAGVILRASPE